jgi:hypothetical protein
MHLGVFLVVSLASQGSGTPQCQARRMEFQADHEKMRDYTDKNSCLTYGPITPTTIPYNPLPPLMS